MFYVDIIKDVNRILQTPPSIVQPPTLFRGIIYKRAEEFFIKGERLETLHCNGI